MLNYNTQIKLLDNDKLLAVVNIDVLLNSHRLFTANLKIWNTDKGVKASFPASASYLDKKGKRRYDNQVNLHPDLKMLLINKAITEYNLKINVSEPELNLA